MVIIVIALILLFVKNQDGIVAMLLPLIVLVASFFLALFNATLDTARAPELREWFDNGAMRVAHVAYD